MSNNRKDGDVDVEEEGDMILFDQANLLTNRIKSKTDVIHGSFKMKLLKTLALCAAFFGLGLCFAILGPTLLDLRCHVKTDISHISYLFTGRSVGYLIGSIVGGFLFDKFNQLLLLSFALFMTSIATGLAPWSSQLIVLAMAIGIQGLTMGFLDTGGNVLCLTLWGKKSGPFMQALHFAFGIGAFISPLIAEPFLAAQENCPNNSLESSFVTPLSLSTVNTTFLSSLGIPLPSTVGTPLSSVGIPLSSTIVTILSASTVVTPGSNKPIGKRKINFMPVEYLARRERQASFENSTKNDYSMSSFSQLSNKTESIFDLRTYSNQSEAMNSDIQSKKSEVISLNQTNKLKAVNISDGQLNITEVISDIQSNTTELVNSTSHELNTSSTIPYLMSSTQQVKANSTSKQKKPKPDTNGKYLPPEDGRGPQWIKPGIPQSKLSSPFVHSSTTTLVPKELTSLNFPRNETLTYQNVTVNSTSSVLLGNSSLSSSFSLNVNSLSSNESATTSNPVATSKLATTHEPTTTNESATTIDFGTTNEPKQFSNLNNSATNHTILENPNTSQQSLLSNLSISDHSNMSEDLSSVVTTDHTSTISSDHLPNNSTNSNTNIKQTKKSFSTTISPSVNIEAPMVTNYSPDTQLSEKTRAVPEKMDNKTISTLTTAVSNKINSSQHIIETSKKKKDPSKKKTSVTKPAVLNMSIPNSISTKVPSNEVNPSIGTKVASVSTSGHKLTSSNTLTPVKITSTTTNYTNSSGLKNLQMSNINGLSGNVDNKHEFLVISSIQFAYLIIAIFIFQTSIAFLVFFGIGNHNLRSLMPIDNKTQDDHYSKLLLRMQLLGLLFVFYFMYVGMEATFGGLIMIFSVCSKLHFAKSSGAYITSLFWGMFALARGFAIYFAKWFTPASMLRANLVLCIVASVILVFFAETYAWVLWFCSGLLGIGMASIFPTGITWLEQYIDMSNKEASILVVGSALGEMLLPVLAGHFIKTVSPMFLMYLILTLCMLSLIVYIIMERVANSYGDKYGFLLLNMQTVASSRKESLEDRMENEPSADNDIVPILTGTSRKKTLTFSSPENRTKLTKKE